jgi:hypothetical protein
MMFQFHGGLLGISECLLGAFRKTAEQCHNLSSLAALELLPDVAAPGNIQFSSL